MNGYLRFILKYTIPLIVLISFLGISACTQNSPFPEDMWTRNIYPGLPNTYNVGSATYPYHQGHFTELFLDGHQFTSGVVSATWVVSAEDSGDVYRADFICDGADDDLEIQAALDALPAIGGRVILLEGTYNTTANIELPANCILEGQGYSTLILANSPTITQVIDIVGNYSAIKNLKIEIALGCGVAGARPNGIYSNGLSNLTIQAVRIIGDTSVAQEILSQQNGIYFIDVSFSIIADCVINNCERNGIYSGSTGVAFGNNFLGNSSYNNIDSGLYISNNRQSVADSNQLTNNGAYGLIVYNSNQCVISNNSCGLNDYYGMFIFYSSNHNVIEGNNCSDNSWSGISLFDECTNNTVVGNVCNSNNDTPRHGIIVYDECDYNTVVGNTCSENGAQGIYIHLSSYCSVVGNVCYDNVGDGIKVHGQLGATADYNVVDANVCYTNGGDGVEIEGDFGGGNNYANENIVTSNQLKGNGGVSLNDDGTATVTDNNVI